MGRYQDLLERFECLEARVTNVDRSREESSSATAAVIRCLFKLHGLEHRVVSPSLFRFGEKEGFELIWVAPDGSGIYVRKLNNQTT